MSPLDELRALRDALAVVAGLLALVLFAIDGDQFLPNLLGAFQ